MSNETNNARNKMLCDPHDGSRSPKFLKFCRDFKAAMSGQFTDKDDMDSLWRAMTGTDQGGQDGRALPIEYPSAVLAHSILSVSLV